MACDFINNLFQSSWVHTYGLKRIVLRLFGAHIGKGVLIKPRVTIVFPWKLHVGNYCWLGENVWIDNLDDVTLGDHTVISQGAYLCTGNHDYTSPHFTLMTKPIVVGSSVWIGAQAVIAPGVNFGDGCVVTMGSVVLKSCESGTVYGGNPAGVLKKVPVMGAV